MISEKKREEIKKEAKQILDKFSKSLSGVKFKEKDLKKEIGGYREEGEGGVCDSEFRESVFENAPQKRDDCIIAEKKKW